MTEEITAMTDPRLDEPLPDAIIVELPRQTAAMLWAISKVQDRSIEYIAAQWLNVEAEKRFAICQELAANLQSGPRSQEETAARRKERGLMTPSMRLGILQRDNFKCVYCGASKGKELHIDHKVPISKGGKTVYENLQVLCADCNLGKAAKPDLRLAT